MGRRKKHLPLRKNVGRKSEIVNIFGKKVPIEIIGEIKRRPSNHHEKAIHLQRVLIGKDGVKHEELRLGYYMIGKKPGMRGKWVWGQYAPFLPSRDFAWFVKKAAQKGWIRL